MPAGTIVRLKPRRAFRRVGDHPLTTTRFRQFSPGRWPRRPALNCQANVISSRLPCDAGSVGRSSGSPRGPRYTGQWAHFAQRSPQRGTHGSPNREAAVTRRDRPPTGAGSAPREPPALRQPAWPSRTRPAASHSTGIPSTDATARPLMKRNKAPHALPHFPGACSRPWSEVGDLGRIEALAPRPARSAGVMEQCAVDKTRLRRAE